MSITKGVPHCDVCKKPLVRDNSSEDEPHGFDWDKAHAHCCHGCFDAEFDRVWTERDPCAECETEPCKRDRDCWFTPRLQFPYETYFGHLLEDQQAGTCEDKMNATELHRRQLKHDRRKERLGPIGEHYAWMCALSGACEGFPDVDWWGGSTIREWWHEEQDSDAMLTVLRCVGMRPIVNRLSTADEIRREVAYEDFIKAVDGFLMELGDWS